MSGQIGDSKINEVRERTDIIELVSQYVTLKRSGANHMGLCPFHSEKSPSFSVHAGRQFYHCFGCGVGGDVFSFLMKMEGLAFPDAVRRLAERAGIDLEERRLSPEEERRQKQRERLYQVNELAVDYFHQNLMELPAGEPGRQYLKKRGYGRKAAAEYKIGYAVDAWEGLANHLQQRGAAVEDARTLGLIRPGKQERGDYDLFRGRLMFPIYDLSGRVVAFGGRVLDDSKPKYINSPESPIYHKGGVLFGLYQVRQAMRQRGEVILVEGYFDQLALYRAGFPPVVATCGTALTADHARLLKRYVQRVLLLFDEDAAGRQATFKAMAALQEEGVPAMVIELPSGEDPDSFVQSQGSKAFQQRLDSARPVMDLFMEDALGKAGAGVAETVRAAEVVVQRLTALNSEMEQDLYLKDLSARSGIELQLLKQKLDEMSHQETQSAARPSFYPELPEPPYAAPPVNLHRHSPREVGAPVTPPWSRAEGMLLALLLHSAQAREKISAAGLEEYFYSEKALLLAAELLRLIRQDVPDLEDLNRRLDPGMEPFLNFLMRVDPEQFSGAVEDILAGCRATLQRENKKKQREQILTQIRLAEQTGDAERAEELMGQFKNFK
ncbi:MAG: DNA primase [Desulfuromonadales bacterium C00003093]|nr:MAG: DNA primase [Desulfuromonadales bacterium C00003093]